MRLDLSTLIAQRNYWKVRSDSFEQAVTALSSRLASLEQLLRDFPDPDLILTEIASLRSQLAEALSSLAESKATLTSLDQKIAEMVERLQQAEARAKALERENAWLKIGLVAAGVAVVGLGVYAAVK